MQLRHSLASSLEFSRCSRGDPSQTGCIACSAGAERQSGVEDRLTSFFFLMTWDHYRCDRPVDHDRRIGYPRFSEASCLSILTSDPSLPAIIQHQYLSKLATYGGKRKLAPYWQERFAWITSNKLAVLTYSTTDAGLMERFIILWHRHPPDAHYQQNQQACGGLQCFMRCMFLQRSEKNLNMWIFDHIFNPAAQEIDKISTATRH